MEQTFDGRRSTILCALSYNRSEIKDLNDDIAQRIAEHKAEIAALKLQRKELRKTKVKGGWLLDFLLRFLQ